MSATKEGPKLQSLESSEETLKSKTQEKLTKLSNLSVEFDNCLDSAPASIKPLKALNKAAAIAFNGLVLSKQIENDLAYTENDWAKQATQQAREQSAKFALATKLCTEKIILYSRFEKELNAHLESAGDMKVVWLFSIWDSDITDVSKESIRGKAFNLFAMQGTELVDMSDEVAFHIAYLANEKEKIRQIQEPYCREALRPQFEEAYAQRYEEAEQPAWKRLAIERFDEWGGQDLKEFMFELFFEEFEDSIQSMDVPLPYVPSIYDTEDIPLSEKVIHLHYFVRDTHIYVAEYRPEEGLLFGYTILNGDLQMAEWGYSSLDEMRELDVHGLKVERDLSWKPKKFGEIDHDVWSKQHDQ